MCLSVVYRGKQKKEALAKLPDRMYCWKVMDEKFCSLWMQSGLLQYTVGEQVFPANTISGGKRLGYELPNYKGGGHFFRHRADAEEYKRWVVSYQLNPQIQIIRTIINKTDITNLGTDSNMNSGLTIVARKAIFPKYVGAKTNA